MARDPSDEPRATSDENMTIQFNCPHCGALIAFDKKHCGKRARCLTCGQLFVIPSADLEKPKKIKLKIERADPLPGFYRAVYVDSWKLFTKPENMTGLVFIATAVCFKFFTARLNFNVDIVGPWRSIEIYVPLGYILHTAAWGFLFWYYMEIIYSTAFEIEELPEVVMGGFYGFIWHIIKSIYTFVIALFVVELPFLIASVILKITGIEWPVLQRVFMLGGLFLFPMAILTVAIGRELTMLRPDYLLVPIFRAFKPYLAMSMLLGAAGFLQMQASQYAGQEPVTAATQLLLNLIAQVLILMAMRAIGFFYKHYTCCLPW